MLWRAQRLGSKPQLLFFAAAVLASMALVMALLWADASLVEPWDLYARFFLMSSMTLLAFPIFALFYHLPEWNSAQRREFQIVLVLSGLRLLFELYWSLLRTQTLVATGFVIERRPVVLDVLTGASLVWIIVIVVRRTRRFQQRFGLFITEAILLGIFTIPLALGQLAYTSSWLSRSAFLIIRDISTLFIIPMIVIVFLDLLSEMMALLSRLLILSVLTVMLLISATSLVIAPLLHDAPTLHSVMVSLIFLALASACAVIIGAPAVLKRSVFRPLRAVLKAVRQVNAGDLSVQVPVVFADEIGQLTEAFNRMVAELHSMIQELELRVQERTAALGRSEARYRELVEQIDEVIFRISLPDLRLEYVSPAIERMLGYPISQMVATPLFIHAIVHHEDRAKIQQFIADLHQEKFAPLYEYRVLHANGEERWLQQSNTGIYQAGQLVAIEGICRDITATRHAEQQLLAQQRELAALHERERIGRDLHDNLGQVIGYVNLQSQSANMLITAGQISEAQTTLTRLTQMAQETHQHIRSYILDLRLPESAPIIESWKTTLQRTIQSFEQRYAFIVELDYSDQLSDNPFSISTGKEVQQIILEALNNVQKHAATNQARLSLERDTTGVFIEIEDQGAGFRIQTEALHTPEQRTMGSLGLTMMRERAMLIHADLQIHSTPGIGTKLTLSIPEQEAPAMIPALPKTDVLAGLRVLLVDDHPLFIEGMRTLLSTRGLNVIGIAQNGLQAQQEAQQLQPDIILMDMHMPECNGPQATAAIKLMLPATKIIMLTVAAEEEHLFEALKAGASGYLLKNLDSDVFFQLLSEAMRGEVVLSPELATQTLLEFPALNEDSSNGAQQANSSVMHTRLLSLSPRQRDVLQRVAAGQTYKEIALALFVTESTIKYHMSQIIELLQVKGRREAIALVRQMRE